MKYIVCPICGAEYHPAEIFISDYIIGNPNHIEKDADGKIIDYIGMEQDLEEQYKCDKCNNLFKITAKIDFTAKPISKLNDKTTVSLRKYSMIMPEK